MIGLKNNLAEQIHGRIENYLEKKREGEEELPTSNDSQAIGTNALLFINQVLIINMDYEDMAFGFQDFLRPIGFQPYII